MANMRGPANVPEELFLPWVESANDRRFKRILLIVVTLFVLVSAIVPFLPVPEIVQKDLKTVAPRLSKLILEKKKQPPPPPPEVKKKVKKEVKKKPVEKKKEVDKNDAARKKAASSGLVALSSELLDLRESFDLPMMHSMPLQKAKDIEKQSFQNDIITSKATSASSGIETQKLTRSTSGSNLSGRTTTKVSSDIGEKVVVARRKSSSGGLSIRNENEIERVFQKNKGAIYSIYNRALRKDPTLAGKVILELTISSAGQVIKCRVISSDLNSPALEKKIVARVKLFKFSSGSVQETTVKYPIDFVPS